MLEVQISHRVIQRHASNCDHAALIGHLSVSA